jgi:methionyl-tRNA formyltransferase
LYPKLSQIGAEVMVQTLQGLRVGIDHCPKQDHSAASLAPILTREDGMIDFSLSAKEIYDRWRGFQPWPGAWTMIDGKKLLVADASSACRHSGFAPGELLSTGTHLFASCRR